MGKRRLGYFQVSPASKWGVEDLGPGESDRKSYALNPLNPLGCEASAGIFPLALGPSPPLTVSLLLPQMLPGTLFCT